MRRHFTALWVIMAAVAGVVTYLVADQVQLRAARLDGLNREIAENRETLRVLRAEWSHLINPADLESRLRSHLGLRPTEATQFASIDDIPVRPIPDATPAASPDATPAASPAVTPTITSNTTLIAAEIKR